MLSPKVWPHDYQWSRSSAPALTFSSKGLVLIKFRVVFCVASSPILCDAMFSLFFFVNSLNWGLKTLNCILFSTLFLDQRRQLFNPLLLQVYASITFQLKCWATSKHIWNNDFHGGYFRLFYGRNILITINSVLGIFNFLGHSSIYSQYNNVL